MKLLPHSVNAIFDDGFDEREDPIQFLKPFPDPVQETTSWLRGFVWKNYPYCNELIYDDYNVLAVGLPTKRAMYSAQ